jgi:hypothetical protein
MHNLALPDSEQGQTYDDVWEIIAVYSVTRTICNSVVARNGCMVKLKGEGKVHSRTNYEVPKGE